MPTPSAPPFPTRSGRVLVVLLVLWGLGAVAGGFALASAKDGSGIGFELDLLEGTPFPDFLLPGSSSSPWVSRQSLSPSSSAGRSTIAGCRRGCHR